MNDGRLDIETIRAALRTRRVGVQVAFVAETDSTNDEAWRRLSESTADGCVVFADYQSAGRGRLGRTWSAPRGAGLLMSVLLVEPPGDPTPAELCLIPAVAACDAIAAVTDVRPTIHWPNDLYVGSRKLAGILVESRRPATPNISAATVIGIGINCLQHRGHFPPELHDRATSLEMESHHAVDRDMLAIALLHRLDHWLARPRAWDHEELRAAWIARAEPPGRRVTLRCGERTHQGTIVDIDPASALVVRMDDGALRAFHAAETTVLPEAAPPPGAGYRGPG